MINSNVMFWEPNLQPWRVLVATQFYGHSLNNGARTENKRMSSDNPYACRYLLSL